MKKIAMLEVIVKLKLADGAAGETVVNGTIAGLDAGATLSVNESNVTATGTVEAQRRLAQVVLKVADAEDWGAGGKAAKIEAWALDVIAQWAKQR